MVQVLTYIPSRGIGYREKTFYFPLIVGVGAAVSLGLNFAHSMARHAGAAIAMLGGQTACLALTLPISQRLYPIPYEWGRLVRLVFAAAATVGAVWLMPDASPLPYQAIKAMLLLAFPGSCRSSGSSPPGRSARLHRGLAAALRAGVAAAGQKPWPGGPAGCCRRWRSPSTWWSSVAGEPGRRSGLTALQRLNEARRAMAAARGSGFPRAWRSLMKLARPRTIEPEAAEVGSHRPVGPGS